MCENKLKLKDEIWVKKNDPDFHLLILNTFDTSIPWKEKIYLYLSKKANKPFCYCGKEVKFLASSGYRKYCSTKCLSNDPEIKEKRKKTNIEKYGSENPMQSDSIKIKFKKSIFEKYGIDNISKLQSIKDKVKNTNQEKYGVDYISQLESTKSTLSSKMRIRSKDLNDLQKIKMIEYISNKVEKFNIFLVEIKEGSVYKFIHSFRS